VLPAPPGPGLQQCLADGVVAQEFAETGDRPLTA